MSTTVACAVASGTAVCGKRALNTIEPDASVVDRASFSVAPLLIRVTSSVSASLLNRFCAVSVSRLRSPPNVTTMLTSERVGAPVGEKVGGDVGAKVGDATGEVVGARVGERVEHVVLDARSTNPALVLQTHTYAVTP